MIVKIVKLYIRVILETIQSWWIYWRQVASLNREFHRQFRKGPKKGTYIRRDDLIA